MLWWPGCILCTGITTSPFLSTHFVVTSLPAYLWIEARQRENMIKSSSACLFSDSANKTSYFWPISDAHLFRFQTKPSKMQQIKTVMGMFGHRGKKTTNRTNKYHSRWEDTMKCQVLLNTKECNSYEYLQNSRQWKTTLISVFFCQCFENVFKISAIFGWKHCMKCGSHVRNIWNDYWVS